MNEIERFYTGNQPKKTKVGNRWAVLIIGGIFALLYAIEYFIITGINY